MAAGAPVLVLITFVDLDQARRVSEALVAEQLAACINLFPGVESIYHWKGRVERAQEVGAVVKTVQSCLGRLEERYKALHSYETPEFLVLPVQGGSVEYLSWLSQSVAGERP